MTADDLRTLFNAPIVAADAAPLLPPRPWRADTQAQGGMPTSDVLDADGNLIADCQHSIIVDGRRLWPTSTNHALARLFAWSWTAQDRIADAVELLDTGLRGGSDFVGRSQVMEAQSVLREALRLAKGDER